MSSSPQVARPTTLFDREEEWSDLASFATASSRGLRIGIIHGRRRQGKSFLLRHLTTAIGGLYHQALQEERAPALASLAGRLTEYAGFGGRFAFDDWREAVTTLVGMAAEVRPPLVVLDEFPYLLDHSPELPSLIQEVYDLAREREGLGTCLILCGSALSVMARLLTGAQALRGRAQLDMPLQPFDYRQARAYWNIDDLDTAFLVHSVVGGTPGYKDLLQLEPPRSIQGFSRWVAKALLNPSHSLFREAEYLLAEEPSFTDRGLYHSVLAAISRGANRPHVVAAQLGRDEASLRYALRMLEGAGLIERDDDMFRQRRPVLRVADPIVRFHHVVIRPNLARLEERKSTEVWQDSREAFGAHVVGPHFEALARRWTRIHASSETLGGRAGVVGTAQVNDPKERIRRQIDVVALAAGQGRTRPKVLLLGEAKSTTQPIGMSELNRLERSKQLLQASQRADTDDCQLALFGRGGFSSGLTDEARRRRNLVLVDMHRLFEGD